MEVRLNKHFNKIIKDIGEENNIPALEIERMYFALFYTYYKHICSYEQPKRELLIPILGRFRLEPSWFTTIYYKSKCLLNKKSITQEQFDKVTNI